MLQVAIAPAVSWLANRISVDFSLSKKLIAKLDAEKGISGNDLLATEEEAAADVKEEKSESIKKEAAEAVKEEKVEGSQKADGKEANGTAEVKEDVKMEESAPADEEKTSVGGQPHIYLIRQTSACSCRVRVEFPPKAAETF